MAIPAGLSAGVEASCQRPLQGLWAVRACSNCFTRRVCGADESKGSEEGSFEKLEYHSDNGRSGSRFGDGKGSHVAEMRS